MSNWTERGLVYVKASDGVHLADESPLGGLVSGCDLMGALLVVEPVADELVCFACLVDARGLDGAGLSAAEAAVVRMFDEAPDADESLRERVARAMSNEVAGNSDYDGPIADLYRQLADAAISVLRGDDA